MRRVWFNGTLTDGMLAIDARDRGLLLGDGVFETMLVLNTTALWANMHLARMESAAKELGLGFDRGTVDDAIDEILEGAAATHYVLRITLTRGSSTRGLGGNGGTSSMMITIDPFDPTLMFQPVTLATSTIRRNTHSPTSRLKTISYIDNIAAAREASAKGMEDALMLNVSGAACCSTIANLFLVKNGMLVTPARDQGILTGVIRQALIAAAGNLGVATEERVVQPAELAKADGVFLTNSLRFIRPVKALDQLPLAQSDLTTFMTALCETARLQCGRDPRLI